jgi:hypothetical protein
VQDNFLAPLLFRRYLPKLAVEALREHHGRAAAEKSPIGLDDRIFTAPESGLCVERMCSRVHSIQNESLTKHYIL